MTWKQAFCTLLLLCCFTGCGLWESKVAFAGSSPRDKIQIKQPFPANGWGIQVVLKGRHSTKTLYQLRGDVFLEFADVVWTRDDHTVAVFTCGTPSLKLAYDPEAAHFIPFSSMETAVSSHIRAQYRLNVKTADDAVFDWACSSDGKQAFLRRYPEAAVR